MCGDCTTRSCIQYSNFPVSPNRIVHADHSRMVFGDIQFFFCSNFERGKLERVQHSTTPCMHSDELLAFNTNISYVLLLRSSFIYGSVEFRVSPALKNRNPHSSHVSTARIQYLALSFYSVRRMASVRLFTNTFAMHTDAARARKRYSRRPSAPCFHAVTHSHRIPLQGVPKGHTHRFSWSLLNFTSEWTNEMKKKNTAEIFRCMSVCAAWSWEKNNRYFHFCHGCISTAHIFNFIHVFGWRSATTTTSAAFDCIYSSASVRAFDFRFTKSMWCTLSIVVVSTKFARFRVRALISMVICTSCRVYLHIRIIWRKISKNVQVKRIHMQTHSFWQPFAFDDVASTWETAKL